MAAARSLAVVVALVVTAALGGVLSLPEPVRPQTRSAADVLLNVQATGAKKINIVIPDFTLLAGPDPQGLARLLPGVLGRDLTFSALFAVVTGEPALPAGNSAALQEAWAGAARRGAHAALHGLLALRGEHAQAEMRLYDLTSPQFPLVASRKVELTTTQARRLAHKIADEVVLQFTGEPGAADTKIAFVASGTGQKELYLMDYDGVGVTRLTSDAAISLSPAWSPDTRSVAFTSYRGTGYPYIWRVFPFEPRRALQLLAGYPTLNSTPAWSPDGRHLALTLNKDGNPEIYVLNLVNGAVRRLTTYGGIDTEPTWSPTGREIAFISERAGRSHVFVMDAEGANVRRLTQAGSNTQPRWSPKGDTIAFTSLQGNQDIWAVSPNGLHLRRLTAGPGNNESAWWAPDGRHLVFQSSRLGGFQLFTMLADGSEQQPIVRIPGEATSASWSPRLP